MPCIICGYEDALPRPPGGNHLCDKCHDKAAALRDRAMVELGCTEEELIKIIRTQKRKKKLIEEALRRFDEITPNDDGNGEQQ